MKAALDGLSIPDAVDKLLEQAAIARLVAEERRGLRQRIETGGADQVLDLLRKPF